MTEPGSDELLAQVGDPAQVYGLADAEQRALDAEEDRVLATEPEDDPGTQYPDPDETPDGDAEEYDPMPPEATS